MRRLLVVAILLALAAPAAAAAAAGPRVYAIRFTQDVNPVTQDWLNGQLDHAASHHYQAAVILLDTPGGLEESMRKIVQKELALPIPVVVYVTPNGARAASAGVWISEAADVLAMAPETNIGSSTPIDSSGQNIGSDLRRKVVNDAAASLRGLAASHGRNAKWADSAVRVASNLTADEALREHVIDVTAPSLPALLAKIDGRRSVARPRMVLHTRGAQIVEASPGFLTRFLSTLIDPNIVSLLFLAGLAGLGFELFHPGVVIPGAFGAICMVCALFGFSVLPLSWAGLGLVLLGAALLVIDAHVTSHGALSVSGLVAMAIGLVTLFHDAPSPYHTSVPLVVTFTAVLGGLWAFAIGKALQARRRPVAIGPGDVVGAEGVVRGDGQVFVRGELWRARAAEPLSPGEHVVVDRLVGLTLEVHPAGRGPTARASQNESASAS
ncbi:MAG TPA: nodulation protein NfeD [Gaiellaceae bacterium]|nr:nodulation protein NfeD [Gaiellaceae bacterium]